MRRALKDKLQGAKNVTVTDDGWTNDSRRSVYGTHVTIPQQDGRRETFLLSVRDASEDSHTGEYLAGTNRAACRNSLPDGLHCSYEQS